MLSPVSTNKFTPAITSQPLPRTRASLLKTPHVLVVITNFGYADFVVHALESVLAQTYVNWTCVIVDDNSADRSVEVITQWLKAENDPRFSLIRKPHNEGQLRAVADALATTSSVFVALLDADDIWSPQHLETHISAHLSHQGFAGLTCSDLVQIDNANAVIAGTMCSAALRGMPHRPNAVAFTVPRELHPEGMGMHHASIGAGDPNPDMVRAVFIRPDMFRWHWSASSALVFRRTIVDLVMPKDVPKGRLCADHYLACMCHYFTGSVVIDLRTGAYRRHGRNGFSSLPIYGSNAETSLTASQHHHDANFDTMLDHVLDQREILGTSFGGPSVYKLISALTGRRVRCTRRIGDRRIWDLLGVSGIAQAYFGELRRRSRPSRDIPGFVA